MKFRVIFLLMAACTFFTSYAAEKDKYLNIVYIGNSITYGAGVEDRLHNAPPVKASMFLRQKPDIKSVSSAIKAFPEQRQSISFRLPIRCFRR